MRRADLAKFHETWFKPNNATLLIVGDTTLAELTPKLEKLFSGWKAGKVPAKNIYVVASSGIPKAPNRDAFVKAIKDRLLSV